MSCRLRTSGRDKDATRGSNIERCARKPSSRSFGRDQPFAWYEIQIAALDQSGREPMSSTARHPERAESAGKSVAQNDGVQNAESSHEV